jgi:hypothetical protein
MSKWIFTLIFQAASVLLPAWAADKHEHAGHSHGQGQLELVVQGGAVKANFEIPMESLLGHEHLPRTEAQKKAMANLQSGLASADYFMALPAAAQCKQISLKASSSMFEGKKSEHSDLDIDVAFECAQPAALTELRISLFAKHPRLMDSACFHCRQRTCNAQGLLDQCIPGNSQR